MSKYKDFKARFVILIVKITNVKVTYFVSFGVNDREGPLSYSVTVFYWCLSEFMMGPSRHSLHI